MNGPQDTAGAAAFYKKALITLTEIGLPFAVGGTFAINFYTGIGRETKDLDVFCKAGNYPKILCTFATRGYRIEVEDERWLAKISKDGFFFDLIFGSSNSVAPVNDGWFREEYVGDLCGTEVHFVPPTELFWAKAFIQDRYKYDGSDIAHLILKQSDNICWDRLLNYMEQYWEVALIQILNFRFIYPTERERIPKHVLDELIARVEEQRGLPMPRTKVCRGRLFSRFDYRIDIEKWGYADVVGEGEKTYEQKP